MSYRLQTAQFVDIRTGDVLAGGQAGAAGCDRAGALRRVRSYYNRSGFKE